ncbi:RagB/SusD family nutrient uptake outer membrane protein [Flavihumibacter sp. CACIAM 22H1]|uniref:RagB/SusD family nutrient uptake outer membrane protein n=1 Tax=Flavihumibacter sp. CACIAM 22H1 TaxID=1812911 RepID=UPI0007A91863|nr:RagB/SusD family nutrient uptake outer membrane protein [Flavihumibacter sp. CACIAM 22H1]KYP15279.1 MAG: glycan metabolism protein [Flavihumibacter sp. CACIAM 22H1]
MKYALRFCILLGMFFASCEKDFLQRTPQTSITKEDFFNTPADLQTYTNGFYSQLRSKWEDLYSDNISVYTGSSEVDNLVRGGITPATVGGWNNWGTLRSINFMLQNTGKTTGDPVTINHYIGIARFFRANFYYNMVKRYGDVPWYGSVIGTSDEDLLYKAKDSRAVVVDSIMNDLEFAAANILPSLTNNTQLTKWAALQLLARIALHEGTYRKYHDEIGLESSAAGFLQKAVNASQKIMEEGGFTIYSTGANALDYRALFSSNNLSANKEVIYLEKNNKEEGIANNTHVVLDWQWALSADLMNDYLMRDGTPFTSTADYDKKTFVQVFQNRDPRLPETIMPPGFTTAPGNTPLVIKPNFGGYMQVKFYPRDPALRGGWVLNYTDLPIFRLAEVLLINAEAKTELGTITQADLDQTINKLRRRVGMPDLSMAVANGNPDPYQAQKYPLVAGAQKGLLLEIRRERRIELACEGFRLDDLYRWKAGQLLGKHSKGMYIPALGAYDVTGDGEEDIAILEQQGAEDPINHLPPNVKNKLIKFYLTDQSYYLENENSGALLFGKDRQQPRNFVEPKYYHFPIPQEQTLLNKNLTQPAGWQ